MQKQINMFAKEDEGETKYTKKISAPIYEPKNAKPNIYELCDRTKFIQLAKEIDKSNLPDYEKLFLLEAAKRHIVFNYEKIADYYANSSKQMQELMEKSALVIIDFDKAIEDGFVRLDESIRKQYLEEYPNE